MVIGERFLWYTCDMVNNQMVVGIVSDLYKMDNWIQFRKQQHFVYKFNMLRLE